MNKDVYSLGFETCNNDNSTIHVGTLCNNLDFNKLLPVRAVDR